MAWTRLGEVNLNLLPVLDALLIECNVTRAAKRLGMTQSAVSHSLGSLRELLGDPVLVRSKSGMAPTRKAAELAPHLRCSLEMLQHALSVVPEFDPTCSKGTLSLSAPDFVTACIGPKLSTVLATEAPGIDLRLHEQRMALIQQRLFAEGTDLLIGSDVTAEAGVSSTIVMTDEFACALRADHPLLSGDKAKKGLTLDGFLEYPHLLISSTGRAEGGVDQALSELGLKRRVAVQVESLLAALPLVAETDMILTASTLVLSLMTKGGRERREITMVSAPLSLPPKVMRAFWDVRREGDPRFGWFLSLVQRTLDDVAASLRVDAAC